MLKSDPVCLYLYLIHLKLHLHVSLVHKLKFELDFFKQNKKTSWIRGELFCIRLVTKPHKILAWPPFAWFCFLHSSRWMNGTVKWKYFNLHGFYKKSKEDPLENELQWPKIYNLLFIYFLKWIINWRKLLYLHKELLIIEIKSIYNGRRSFKIIKWQIFVV